MNFNKRHLHKISSAIALLTCGLALWSCTRHDYDVDDHGGNISFAAAAVDELRSADSLASPSEETVNITPLHAEGEGAGQLPQLYLHEIVSDMDTPMPSDSLSYDAESRAIDVKTKREINNINVTAISYTGDWSRSSDKKLLFKYLHVGKAKRGDIFPTSYYWPTRRYKVKFFAFAPGTLIPTNADHIIRQDDTFGREMHPEDEPDILVATADGQRMDTPQPLRFEHIFAGVRFVMGDGTEAVEVTGISIKEVYFRARYNMVSKSWNTFSDSHDWPVSQDIIRSIRNASRGKGNIPQLLFLPQSFQDNSKVIIQMTIKGIPVTLSANLRNPRHQGWKRGQVTTYKISTSNIVVQNNFVVRIGNKTLTSNEQQNKFSVNFKGGRLPLSVTSEKKLVNQKNPHKPVALVTNSVKWHIYWRRPGERAYREGNLPQWVGLPSLNYNGNSNGVISLNKEKNIKGVHDFLKVRGKDNVRYDLSITNNPKNRNRRESDKKRSTANCYVIDKPGIYRFPLVYGNAINEELPGEQSKSWLNNDPDTAEEWTLVRFYDHSSFSPNIRSQNSSLYSPYITRESVVTIPSKNRWVPPVRLPKVLAKGAQLVWQDHPNLITNLRLVKGRRKEDHYIEFTVTEDNINQGNALIALRGGNEGSENVILWSWHIWVTPTDLWKENTVKKGTRPKRFLPNIPLGWKYKTFNYYPKEDIQLKFVQEGTNKELLATITRTDHTEKSLYEGSATYYEWGRKDPFVPRQPPRTGQPDKVLGQNNYKIRDGILHPDWFFHLKNISKSWSVFPEKFYNLWDNSRSNKRDRTNHFKLAGSKKNKTLNDMPVKTIYDPSPVGFVVPPTGFFFNNTNFIQQFRLGYIPDKQGSNGIPQHKNDRSPVWTAYPAKYPAYINGWAAYPGFERNDPEFSNAVGCPIFPVNEDWATN